MSSSDTEEFKPIDVNSLESFGEEQATLSDRAKPDFDRFEMLFEKPKFEKEESYEFKAMYDGKKEKEEIIFKPLVEKKEKFSPIKGKKRKENDFQSSESPEKEVIEEPKETLEEKGYREGLEKGFEQGQKEGQKQGFEEGFNKGEAEGFAKGEKDGIEKGEEKGLDQGLKKGEEKGEIQVREKAAGILNSLEVSLKTADQTLDLLVEKYEERIISFIQQIAEKAVMARIEVDEEIVRTMILDALKTLVQPEEVVLSVSQDDYEYIEMIKDEFFEEIGSLTSVSIKSDPSIKRGGCKIDTITASVSTDVESRLEAIFEAIKKAGVA